MVGVYVTIKDFCPETYDQSCARGDVVKYRENLLASLLYSIKDSAEYEGKTSRIFNKGKFETPLDKESADWFFKRLVGKGFKVYYIFDPAGVYLKVDWSCND